MQPVASGMGPMMQTTAEAASSMTAPCPKCATTMILAAITPHPIATQMQRHTFLCTTCNQTKTYMLPAKEAVSVAALS